jgi:signal transduction histidine kinase
VEAILVIDDDSSVLDFLRECLTAEGFTILEAPNGEEGVRLAREHHPDVVLCDIGMPGLDGYGVLEALRHDRRTADVDLIFLSGRSTVMDLRRGMGCGADDYLPKPFTPEELLSAIRTRIDRRRAHREWEESRRRELAADLGERLAHELRTCLCAILPAADLLAGLQRRGDAAGAEEVCRFLQAGSQRLHKAVERFLFYSRLVASAGEDDRAKIWWQTGWKSRAVQDALIQLARDWRREGDLRLSLGSLDISRQTVYLGAIANELVDNAFRFSDAGSAVIVEAGMDPKCCALRVADEGCGMSKEQVESINASRQFEGASPRRTTLGLGLPIVELLVKYYGGSLVVVSRHGCGTVVSVRFPLPAARPPQNPGLRSSAPPAHLEGRFEIQPDAQGVAAA